MYFIIMKLEGVWGYSSSHLRSNWFWPVHPKESFWPSGSLSSKTSKIRVGKNFS